MHAQIDPPFKILFDIDFHEVAFGMPVHDITYHDPAEVFRDKCFNEFLFSRSVGTPPPMHCT